MFVVSYYHMLCKKTKEKITGHYKVNFSTIIILENPSGIFNNKQIESHDSLYILVNLQKT